MLITSVQPSYITENSLNIFSHKTLEYTALTAYMNGMNETGYNIMYQHQDVWLMMTDNFFLSYD